jgi:hypothetical protein
MDKLRAVLRRPDRDHLAALAPHIQVFGPRQQPVEAAAYPQLVTAIATWHLVRVGSLAGYITTHVTRE